VAFSPDGRTLLTVSDDGRRDAQGGASLDSKQGLHAEVRLWKAATGAPIGAPLRCPTNPAGLAATFSPDSRTLTLRYTRMEDRLHDLFTFQPLGAPLQLPDDMGVWASRVASSPDGRFALTWRLGGRGPISLWEVTTGRHLRDLNLEGEVIDFGFGPDGKTILASSWLYARRWETATGKLVELPLGLPPREKVLAYSPDGHTALTCQEERVVSVSSGIPGEGAGTATIGKEWPTMAVLAWSPDERFLLGAYADEARLWERATGRALPHRFRHRGWVAAGAFSPDGKTVLTDGGGETRLWDVATGAAVGEPYRHRDNVVAARFSSDGKTVAVTTGNMIAWWGVATGEPRGELFVGPQPGPAAPPLLFTPDSRALLVASGTGARLWDVTTGKILSPALSQPVSHATFSPDYRLAALAVPDGVHLWDVASGASRGLLPHPHAGAWQQQRQKLEDLGGPPSADDTAPLLAAAPAGR
jgi:WD40 repeat protein